MNDINSRQKVSAPFRTGWSSEKTKPRNFFRVLNVVLLVALLMASLLEGCASPKIGGPISSKTHAENPPEGGPAQVGEKRPITPTAAAVTPEVVGVPQPTPSPSSDVASPRPSTSPIPSLQGLAGPALREITLVVGSGGAYALSAVGALQVLTDEKIPVGALSGTGVGALVAAIYSLHPRVGRLEWEIEKLITPLWERKGAGWIGKLRSALPRLDSRAEVITKEMNRIFRDRQFGQLQLKLQVLVEDQLKKESGVIQEGPVGKAIQAALGDGGQFPFVREGDRDLGKSDAVGYSVSDVRVFNRGPILVLDTRDQESNQRSSPVVERELSLADWVVRPDFTGIKSTDFERRSEIYLRGRDAMRLKIADIRRALAEGGGQ